jgi:hypothetical protein
MAYPDVTVTVSDGALGYYPQVVGTGRAKIGVCTSGVVGTTYACNTIDDVKNNLGNGPLAEAVAYDLAIAGAPVYATVATAGNVGTTSAVTKTGSSPTVTASASSPKDSYFVKLTVSTANTSSTGASTFAVSLDDKANSVSGAAATTIAPISLASTNSVAISDSNGISTGIVVSIAAGTTVVGDTYQFRCYEPSMTLANAQTALAALAATPYSYQFVHVVGAQTGATDSTNVTTALAFIAGVDTTIGTSFTATKRWIRAICDMPDIAAVDGVFTSAWDALVVSGAASTTTLRTGAGAGHVGFSSALNGTVKRRCVSTLAAARIGSNITSGQQQIDAAYFGAGAYPGITPNGLYRDERAMGTSLNDSRFITMRTVLGRTGYYLTSTPMLTSSTSDYKYLTNGMIMDIFTAIVNDTMIDCVNIGVRVNANGTIYAADAIVIENAITSRAQQSLPWDGASAKISPPTGTTPIAQVDRTNNVLSTGIINVRGRITPLGYVRSIALNVGYNNVTITNAVKVQ